MPNRNLFIEELKEMLADDQSMAHGQPEEIIYQIDDIYVYGGFEYGVRGVDHNSLLGDHADWDEILSWGILVVPETRTYISDSYEREFGELGYERLGLNSNHIVGFNEQEESSIDFKVMDIPDSVPFGHTSSDAGYDELQAYINFHAGTVELQASGVTFETKSIEDYDITEEVMQNILNHLDEETEELLDNIVGDLYSSHGELESPTVDPEHSQEDLIPDECSFDFDDMDNPSTGLKI